MSLERRNRRAAQRKYFLKQSPIDLRVDAKLLEQLTEEESKALNDIIKLASFNKETLEFSMSKAAAKDYKQYIHYLRTKYSLPKEFQEEHNKLSPILAENE